MLRSSISIGLLILYGTILAEDIVSLDKLNYNISYATDKTLRTGRFGFSALNDLRRSFCRTFCIGTSVDTMPYLMNLLCAAKCPELYLPHGTTESTSMSTSGNVTSAVTTASPTTEGTTTMPTTTQRITTMPTNTQGTTTVPTNPTTQRTASPITMTAPMNSPSITTVPTSSTTQTTALPTTP